MSKASGCFTAAFSPLPALQKQAQDANPHQSKDMILE